jgi:hypothetical protein
VTPAAGSPAAAADGWLPASSEAVLPAGL